MPYKQHKHRRQFLRRVKQTAYHPEQSGNFTVMERIGGLLLLPMGITWSTNRYLNVTYQQSISAHGHWLSLPAAMEKEKLMIYSLL
jgi:hypothetical protein